MWWRKWWWVAGIIIAGVCFFAYGAKCDKEWGREAGVLLAQTGIAAIVIRLAVERLKRTDTQLDNQQQQLKQTSEQLRNQNYSVFTDTITKCANLLNAENFVALQLLDGMMKENNKEQQPIIVETVCAFLRSEPMSGTEASPKSAVIRKRNKYLRQWSIKYPISKRINLEGAFKISRFEGGQLQGAYLIGVRHLNLDYAYISKDTSLSDGIKRQSYEKAYEHLSKQEKPEQFFIWEEKPEKSYLFAPDGRSGNVKTYNFNELQKAIKESKA